MLLEPLLDFVFPPACIMCGSRLGRGLDCGSFCANCAITSQHTIEPDCDLPSDTAAYCERCGEPDTHPSPVERVCLHCFLWPLPCRQLRSLWRYELRVEDAIKRFKYGAKSVISKSLSAALFEGIARSDLFSSPDWDVVVSLPSTTAAIRARGFAHTSFLARQLAASLQIDAAVCALNLHPRCQQQTAVEFQERYENMKRAFFVPERQLRHICEKRVLLIDDVLTTGSSSMHAALALLDAGAELVDIYTVCRSVNFPRRRIALARSLGAQVDATKLD